MKLCELTNNVMKSFSVIKIEFLKFVFNWRKMIKQKEAFALSKIVSYKSKFRAHEMWCSPAQILLENLG